MVCWPVFSFFEVRDDALLAQVAASKQPKSSRTVAQPATETDGLALRSNEKNVSSLDKGSCISWIFVLFANRIS